MVITKDEMLAPMIGNTTMLSILEKAFAQPTADKCAEYLNELAIKHNIDDSSLNQCLDIIQLDALVILNLDHVTEQLHVLTHYSKYEIGEHFIPGSSCENFTRILERCDLPRSAARKLADSLISHTTQNGLHLADEIAVARDYIKGKSNTLLGTMVSILITWYDTVLDNLELVAK